jgi:MFS family permease
MNDTASKPWHHEMTRYHWFVLAVAAAGWLFDCLDQQLFVLARPAAMRDLVTEVSESQQARGVTLEKARSDAGNLATSIFLAGWATGGLFFGMLGDRIGRAKTMLITILLYSVCTGLSALSTGLWDFCFYRFLTGLGVGGEFAVGVALVAEVMPASARPRSLSLLQAFSAVGNVTAAMVYLSLGVAEEEGLVESPWRVMFVIGAAPALLALLIRARLKEPEKWSQASHAGAISKQLGSYAELLGNPLWRKHALLGLVLACSGVIGLWAVGFFTPDLTRIVQRKGEVARYYTTAIAAANAAGNTAQVAILEELRGFEADPKSLPKELSAEQKELKGVADKVIGARLTRWASYSSIMINLGAFCGMFGFGVLSQRVGRKPAFVVAFLAAFVSTVTVFWFLNELWHIFVLVPIMGFCQLSLFAGYAMYFPELFPTSLRSTGTSFCYNVGRFVAAGGPVAKSWIEGVFADTPEPLRYAGVTMSLVFLVGLLVLPLLPETRGKPLPD